MDLKYRPDIDGLRAIAVFAVIGFHAFPRKVVGGFVGVDIFFVISGFLISTIIFRDLDRGKFSLLDFYNRRIRRIFPALIVVMAAILAFGWFVLVSDEYLQLGKHLIASALFSQNFILWRESGYFDTSAQAKPMLHLWSLAIEEQFYAFWPLLLMFGRKRKLSFPMILAVVFILSFLSNIYFLHTDQSADYYLPITRFWELMTGSILAYIFLNHPGVLKKHENIRSVLGVILIGLSIVLIDEKSGFPGWWAIVPTLGSALAISAGSTAYLNKKLLSNKLLVFVGLISYPLYLWHWPLLSFGFIINPLLARGTKLILIASAIVAATLTYHLVELPIRSRKHSPLVPVYLLGTLTLLPICGVLILAGIFVPRLDIKSMSLKNEWDFLKTQPVKYDRNGDGIYPFYPDRAQVTIFIGDSQIAQYAKRISVEVQNQEANGAVLAIGGGCVPLKDVFTDDQTRSECPKTISEGLKRALDPRVSVVVIGGSWNWYLLLNGYYYRDKQGNIPLSSDVGQQRAFRDLKNNLEEFKNQGKRVVLLLGNPINPGFDPHAHIPRLSRAFNFASNPYVPWDDKQQSLRRSLLQLAADSGAEVVDPSASLCQGNECRWVSEDGVPIFSDTSHFNPDWAVANAVFIDPTVKQLPVLTGLK